MQVKFFSDTEPEAEFKVPEIDSEDVDESEKRVKI